MNADQVVPEAKFIEDLGADSLDTVELFMALEEEFGKKSPMKKPRNSKGRRVIKYIEELGRGK